MSFLVTRSILERGGRVIAQVPSLQEDPEGHYITMLNQNLQFEAPFLREAIERVFTRYEIDQITLTEYLQESPLFDPSKHAQLLEGVAAYLRKDHIAAIAILVPIIEAAIRRLLQLNGVSTYKRARYGGLDFRMLGDCLYNPCVVSTFGEDIRDYFVALLVDSRGWNIRNNVSHGLLDDEHFSAALSDRVLHVLLLLALVRKAEDTS